MPRTIAVHLLAFRTQRARATLAGPARQGVDLDAFQSSLLENAPTRPAKSVQPAREGSPRLRGPPGGPPVAVRRVVAERRRCKPPSYGEP